MQRYKLTSNMFFCGPASCVTSQLSQGDDLDDLSASTATNVDGGVAGMVPGVTPGAASNARPRARVLTAPRPRIQVNL